MPQALRPDRPQAADNAASGGLGLTVDQWKAIHGEPVETQSDEFLDRYTIGGNNYVAIRFAMNTTDQMTYLEFSFEPPVELAVAQAMVETYLPDDATVVDEYRHEIAERPVVLYHSEWLAEVGPPADSSWWFAAEPGAFAVTYGWPSNNRTDGPVVSATIVLGHRP